MFKPHRGYHKPKIQSQGINQFALVKFLEEAKERCEKAGDKDSAFRFECMVDYFKNDYEPGTTLKFHGGIIGF